MTEDTDLFPETKPIEVQITAPIHLLRLGIWHGLRAAREVLEEHRVMTPGYHHALALVTAEEAKSQHEMAIHNYAAAAKAGVDIAQLKSIGFNADKLICTPYAPGEAG